MAASQAGSLQVQVAVQQESQGLLADGVVKGSASAPAVVGKNSKLRGFICWGVLGALLVLFIILAVVFSQSGHKGSPPSQVQAPLVLGPINYVLPIESGIINTTTGSAPLPKYCDYAIVGAGPGGIYAAYRLLSGMSPKPSVCVFEGLGRVGGRIYTLRGLGPQRNMVLDTGAYRYIDGYHTLVQSVVENQLKLKYALYDPNSTTFRKIVDEQGSSVGFVTFVERLAKLAQAQGLSLYFNTQVVRVDRVMNVTAPGTGAGAAAGHGGAGGGSGASKTRYLLTVKRVPPGAAATGAMQQAQEYQVAAGRVIFNVPQRPLFRILQASNIVRYTPWSPALFMPFPNMASKLYVYYEDAWWIYMNKTFGSLSEPNFNNATTFNQSTLFTDVPLRGRYHDGDYKCSANRTKCSGFFLVTYAGDNGVQSYSPGGQGLDINPYYGVVPRFYWAYAVNPDLAKPYVVINASINTGKQLLQAAHNKLVAYHAAAGIPIPEPYASVPPTQAVVVVWDAQISWTGGGWHAMKNGAAGFQVNANGVPVAALQPFAGEELYVANEAFSSVQGWAEGSLIMAENIVMRLGAARPPREVLSPERHDCVLYDKYNYNTTVCSLSLNPLQGYVR